MVHTERDLRVSVICTVLNEAACVGLLLRSLTAQTRRPDEIIIVDGGSQDDTVAIARSLAADTVPLRVLVAQGANIAEGRNIAVRHARYDIIASIDGGCRAHRDWLHNLLRPFQDGGEIDVVAGFWRADPRSSFEECVAELIYPRVETLNEEEFLPSGRCVAFRRVCWQSVGGYPEWLYTGEDSLFDLKVRDAGYRFVFAKDAIVYWRPRATWRSLFRQYYLYARGAADPNILSRTIFKAYGANVVVHVVSAMKSMVARKRVRALVYSFPCLAVVFVAKVAGVFVGRVRRVGDRKSTMGR